MNTALLLLAFAAGDPIPKESDEARIKREWGELVDQGGKTAIKLIDDKLKMTIPAGNRIAAINTNLKSDFAPYVYKTMQGDFVAKVTVYRHSAPDNATANLREFITSSGLIAIFKDGTVLTFCRYHHPSNSENQFRSDMRSPFSSMSTSGGHAVPAKQDSIQIRMTRSGDLMDLDYSFDNGKKWSKFTTQKRLTKDQVKIGIFAEHSCDAITEAIFSQFEIKTIDMVEKK
ncbi:MAG: hypothetical protein U0798_04000 [Gemmataceae bacterium]